MTFNLRNRMMLYISIPIVLVLVFLSVFTYYQSSAALDAQIRRTSAYLVESYSNEIQKRLAEKDGIVGALAKEFSVLLPAEADTKRILEHIAKSTPGVQNAFVGLADRRFIDGSGWVAPSDYDPRTRDWYKKAIESQGTYYTDVYVDAITKKPVISVTQAIRSGNQVVGVVGIDLALDEIQQITKGIKVGKTGTAFLLNREGGYVYHETMGLEHNIFKIQNGVFAAPGKEFLSGKPVFQEFTFNGVKKIYASTPVGKTGWALVGATPQSELFEAVVNMGMLSAVCSIVGLLLLIIVIFFIARSIANPIKEMAGVAQQVSEGNLTVQFRSTKTKDEIGILSDSFLNMINGLRTLVRQTNQSAEQLAASSEELTASAQQSAEAAGNVASSIQQVAIGSEKQVSAVNETSAVVQEISATLEEVAATANEMAAMAEKTTKATKDGQISVDRAVTQMSTVGKEAQGAQKAAEELKAGSQQIGEIVGLISSIAGQTNLLALNAAIEAARAGEAGRGFAVVAEEVRKLAEQSEDAARRITALIGKNNENIGQVVGTIDTAISAVGQGVELVNVAGGNFSEIGDLVSQVAKQVAVISKALQETAAGSQRIVTSIKEVENLSRDAAAESQNVSAATEEQSASMEEIASSSHALSTLSQELQNTVAKFRI